MPCVNSTPPTEENLPKFYSWSLSQFSKYIFDLTSQLLPPITGKSQNCYILLTMPYHKLLTVHSLSCDIGRKKY